MPTYGTPSGFAIEFLLDEDHSGPWLNGQARSWVGGREAGSGWRWMSLRDLLGDLEGRERDWGRRDNPRLYRESLPRLFEQLNGALYQGTDAATDAIAIDEEWARHEILPASVFGAKLFTVDNGECSRVIAASDPWSLREVVLPRGEVDVTLRSVRDDLRTRLDDEVVKQSR